MFARRAQILRRAQYALLRMTTQGLEARKLSSAARVMKRSSAHSPRALGWRMRIPGVFIGLPALTLLDLETKKRGPEAAWVIFLSIFILSIWLE